jgi:hypothetical protein
MANNKHFLPKSNTREHIIKLRSSNLCLTMSEIARNEGVSRQHVYQVLKKEGLPTKHNIKKYQYECPVCGTISTKKFCSKQCKIKWRQIPMICTKCGILFFRYYSQLLTDSRRGHTNAFFCSKECRNQWLVEQYGFHTPRKYNWDGVWKSHLETGYGALRLSKLLNIPVTTISAILNHYKNDG